MSGRVQVDLQARLAAADTGLPDASLDRLSAGSTPDPGSALSTVTDTPLDVSTDLEQIRGVPVNIHTLDAENPSDKFAANTVKEVQIAGYGQRGNRVEYKQLTPPPQKLSDPLSIRMPRIGAADFKKDGEINPEYWKIDAIETLCTQTVVVLTAEGAVRQMQEDKLSFRPRTVAEHGLDPAETIRASYGPGSKLQIELTNSKIEKAIYLDMKETPAGAAMIVEQGGERKLLLLDDIARIRPENYRPGGSPEPTGFRIPLKEAA